MFSNIFIHFFLFAFTLPLQAQTTSFLLHKKTNSGLLFQSDSWSAESFNELNSPLFKCFPLTLKTDLLSGNIDTHGCQFLISKEGFQNVSEPKENEKLQWSSTGKYDGTMSIYSIGDQSRFRIKGESAILLEQILQGKKDLTGKASGPKDLEPVAHDFLQCKWMWRSAGGFKQHLPYRIFICEFRLDQKGNVVTQNDWLPDPPKLQPGSMAILTGTR